jgi:S-adenosylhomocysteine hydrolase
MLLPTPRPSPTPTPRLKLATMGVTIDQLTQEQAKYLASWDEGT